LAGAFITFGALFSVLLSTGVKTTGLKLLLQGFGFSVGFFMVILSNAVLFTETNVVLPASYLNCTRSDVVVGALKFWILAIIGNAAGALIVGTLLTFTQSFSAEVIENLTSVVEKKMVYMNGGSITNWFQIVISGVFGNWMVGMAAIFAMMGRTIIGKYLPIFLLVTMFVAGNLQHSPANMGYFSLAIPLGVGPGWGSAVFWSLIPAAIGNVLGGTLLVALPFYYALNAEKEGEFNQ
jgi:formate/nitrite transporter FocA (FNT family)